MRIPVPYGPQLSLLSGLFQGGAQAQARGQEMAMRERALAAQVAEAAARQRLAERSQAHSERSQREGMEFEKFRFGEGHRQRLAEAGQAQGFQAGEAEKGRGFQSGESALERALRQKMHGETLGVQERGLGLQERGINIQASEAQRAGAEGLKESRRKDRAEQRELDRIAREAGERYRRETIEDRERRRAEARQAEADKIAAEARGEERRRFEIGRGYTERREAGTERSEARGARERAYGAALQSLQAIAILAQELQTMNPDLSIEQARVMAEDILERSAAGLRDRFEGR